MSLAEKAPLLQIGAEAGERSFFSHIVTSSWLWYFLGLTAVVCTPSRYVTHSISGSAPARARSTAPRVVA
jgi:hypothetical protein